MMLARDDNKYTCDNTVPALVPQTWNTRDYDAPSCATAAFCGNNLEKLKACCGDDFMSIDYFPGAEGNAYNDYVYCTIKSNSTSAYREYQNCLFNAGTFPYKCNDEDSNIATFNTCNDTALSPPGLPSANQESCAIPNGPNAASAFQSCCHGSNSVNTTFDSGCYAFCIADMGVSKCLEAKVDNATALKCVTQPSTTTDPSSSSPTVTGTGSHAYGKSTSVSTWAQIAGLSIIFLMFMG